MTIEELYNWAKKHGHEKRTIVVADASSICRDGSYDDKKLEIGDITINTTYREDDEKIIFLT